MHTTHTRRRFATALCALVALLVPLTASTAHAQEKRLKSWGNNRSGQLGDGTWTDFRTTATTVLGLTSAEVVKIVAGGGGAATGHGLALLTDRTVQSWGANGSGQLGDGSVFSHNAPGQVVNLSNATDIAAGGWHSLALLADQTVVAWGRNDHGQLGNGTNADSSVPVRVEASTRWSRSPRASTTAWHCARTAPCGPGATTPTGSSVTAAPPAGTSPPLSPV